MASIVELILRSGLEVTQVIVGMIVETSGIVTQIPGYDFKLVIHIVTKDENVMSRHEIVVPSNGQTLAEFRLEYIGRYVLTVQDDQGRAMSPIKGRCIWAEKRNVLISSVSEFEIKCKGRHDTRSDVYAMFNDVEKKRLTLPMPPLGWRIAILTFATREGDYNFVIDGAKEQPLIRSTTAQPQTTQKREFGRPTTALKSKNFSWR